MGGIGARGHEGRVPERGHGQHWQRLTRLGWLSWADANGDKVFRYLRDDNQQTVISFYAPSLDWQDTVDFLEDLDRDLGEGGDAYRVSGRGIILAQISEDVARSAVASTGIVAGMILLMLVGINVSREERPARGALKGLVMWIPLAVVVVWVYGLMGWLGYQLNSQTVTIGALTLGLGVDYAVHFVTRLDEEVEHDPNAGISKWVSITNATTGRAMMAAALTTAGGFAVLNLSSLLPLSSSRQRRGYPARLAQRRLLLPDEPLRPATQAGRQSSQNRPYGAMRERPARGLAPMWPFNRKRRGPERSLRRKKVVSYERERGSQKEK